MARHARLAFVSVGWLFVACRVLQLFLVGLDVFKAGLDPSVHATFAYTYGWLLPAMLVLGRVGRLGRPVLVLTVVLLLLYAVQTILPSLADVAPPAAAVHAVLALVIFWLAVSLTLRATARVRQDRT